MSNTTIQIRGGTASEWTTANPVLAEREAGVETDTNKLKFGNGTDTWDDLPYFGGAVDLTVEPWTDVASPGEGVGDQPEFPTFPYSAPETFEGWHVVGSGGGEPDYENDWEDGGGGSRFRVGDQGTAQFEISAFRPLGASLDPIFTLPSGYRPASEFTADTTVVATSGEVSVTTGDSLSTTFNFPVDGAVGPPDPVDAPVWSTFAFARFYKDPVGEVHLQGKLLGDGSISEPIVFQLPEGYLPDISPDDPVGAVLFAPSDDISVTTAIAADGVIRRSGGSNTTVLLDGITFRAAE